MFADIELLIQSLHLRSYRNENILVLTTNTPASGFSFVEEMLHKILDSLSVLYLSGGRTPKELYAQLAKGQLLTLGAAGLVDERYGEPMHAKSNERMIKETGLTHYFTQQDIPFYPILRHPEFISGSQNEEMLNHVQQDKYREETAQHYDDKIRELQAFYRKHIALLGVGVDGHTAGLPALSAKLKIQNSKIEDVYERSKNRMVIDYNDTDGFYKERVTMTFQGLSMMDLLIVMVFGEDKKEALKKMFADGSEEEIPARFFKRPEIAPKTLLLTDLELSSSL